jgi:hypothetical protein
MSNPATLNLDGAFSIYQGEQYNLTLTAQSGGIAENLTGFVAKSQIRENFQAVNVAIQFSASSGLGPNGVITLSATTAQTVSLDSNKSYVWDLKIESGGNVRPLARGTVKVLARVTR